MPIKTLLIDLGNVLLYFSHARMCVQMAEICQVPVRELERILFGEHLQHRFERGQLTEEGFRDALQSALGRPLDFEELRRAGSDIFALNAPMVPLLDGWKRNGYRLVLLSNTCVTHYEWIRQHFDVLDRFDHCVLSYQVGAVKPEDAIFEAALASSDCAPAECFYTDDVPEYVERGRSFGLHAEVFREVPMLRKQLERLGVRCEG
jgi:putative hydrolase of the HAD superfamily